LNLPILTSAQMRAAEEAAFARGVEVEALMDTAGTGVAQAVTGFFRKPGKCIVFAGKGNNAGDALVAAECLRRLGWKIEVRLAFQEADCSGLMRKKLESLRRRPPEILGATPARSGGTDLGVILVELFAEAAEELSAAQEAIAAEAYIATAAPLIILDGLLGLGAKPPLRDPIRAACRSINQLRASKGAYVFAVDLPTGLDGDSGKTDRDCVIADFTVTIGFAKPGLLADKALNFVGRLEVVHLDELRSPEKKAKEIVAALPALRDLLPRRNVDVLVLLLAPGDSSAQL
jgi:NAD(P)H-hydrate repair Nnr-like enzyme with NAD(P)H-hydrate epimerase domain